MNQYINLFYRYQFIMCFVLLSNVDLIKTSAQKPTFRIIAPEFICPRDENGSQNGLDQTVIRLQTRASEKANIEWTVRWTPLNAPTQRFTLLLWRAVRHLEATLNKPQAEPYVYVIDNSELPLGVDYIFNVTAVSPMGQIGDHKSFKINYVSGKKNLDLEDAEVDFFSVVLLGSQTIYASMDYTVEALVTTCRPTQDFHLVWSVQDNGVESLLPNVSEVRGSRLVVPPGVLRVDRTYDVICDVVRSSDGEFMAQSSLSVTVLRRGIDARLNADVLLVTVHLPFSISVTVFNYDYLLEPYKWTCTLSNTDKCDFFENVDQNSMYFKTGLPQVGEYTINVTVNAENVSSYSQMIIIGVEPLLPILQVNPMSRLLNEGSDLLLVANASNVTPSCKLTWYFENIDSPKNTTCEEDCQHGQPLADTLTVFSIEENFLNELADYTNDTEWREVTAQTSAQAGRARFVASCGCSLTFSCNTAGLVYLDLNFELNNRPRPQEISVSPNTGVALETVFRLSSLTVPDTDVPLTYSFYCGLREFGSLLLASYIDHRAVDTVLPYVENGVDVWVEVCDSLGACGRGPSKIIDVTFEGNNDLAYLAQAMQGHCRRCELLQMQKLTITALVTYKNAKKTEELESITETLTTLLKSSYYINCFE